jgi:hypothetical protein
MVAGMGEHPFWASAVIEHPCLVSSPVHAGMPWWKVRVRSRISEIVSNWPLGVCVMVPSTAVCLSYSPQCTDELDSNSGELWALRSSVVNSIGRCDGAGLCIASVAFRLVGGSEGVSSQSGGSVVG